MCMTLTVSWLKTNCLVLSLSLSLLAFLPAITSNITAAVDDTAAERPTTRRWPCVGPLDRVSTYRDPSVRRMPAFRSVH